MSEVAPTKVGLGRRLAGIISWAIGVLLILSGLAGAAAGPAVASRIGGLVLALAGALILPPVVGGIRQRVAVYRSMWAPALACIVMAFVSGMIGAGSMPVSPETQSPEALARSEADRTTEIAEIEALIAEGTVESTRTALRRLERREFREDVAEGGTLRPLLDRATAAVETARVRGEVNGYLARLAESRTKVEAVFTERPETELVINLNLETLDEAARLLKDGEEFASDAEAREAMTALRRLMVQKQTAAFPAMRAGYGAIKDEAVWESDMDIAVLGGGNRTIRFTAAIFAANRNIARFEETVRPTASQLRFRRTQYEWYRGSEYTYYDLETPGDADIGYWSGSLFTPVPAPE